MRRLLSQGIDPSQARKKSQRELVQAYCARPISD
ncbi:MAG: hypothetical protein GY822_25965 [Deltaproteobacteria bacterium]|nr:hypothetical protein [Deltaproteobacteria bacterium]